MLNERGQFNGTAQTDYTLSTGSSYLLQYSCFHFALQNSQIHSTWVSTRSRECGVSPAQCSQYLSVPSSSVSILPPSSAWGSPCSARSRRRTGRSTSSTRHRTKRYENFPRYASLHSRCSDRLSSQTSVFRHALGDTITKCHEEYESDEHHHHFKVLRHDFTKHRHSFVINLPHREPPCQLLVLGVRWAFYTDAQTVYRSCPPIEYKWTLPHLHQILYE